MRMRWPILLLVLCGSLLLTAFRVEAREPVTRTWTIDGTKREALLWLPKETPAAGASVVFLFHGHGGTAAQIARSLPIPELWPQALVVSMQGLPTAGVLTDREGRLAGWQPQPGAEGDRDVKFFDAVLATLRSDYRIDALRIYATGHSNGGSFTYLLWAVRRDVFAAFAPSSAVAGRFARQLTPAPVLHAAGRTDELVKFAWQERMMTYLRELNSCAAAGERQGEFVTRYASASGNPTLTFIHPGGHTVPRDAAAAIIGFFQTQVRPQPVGRDG